MKCNFSKSHVAFSGVDRIKFFPPGTFSISTIQYEANPEVWQYFTSRLRAVGLQFSQLSHRDQILLYHAFAEELEKKKNGV